MNTTKAVVPKIMGVMISRSTSNHIATVQIKNGSLWQSYSLHDSNIVFCELESPQVGAVVLFRCSQQPKKTSMLPFAFQAEIFKDVESLKTELLARSLDVERARNLVTPDPPDSIEAKRIAAIEAGILECFGCVPFAEPSTGVPVEDNAPVTPPVVEKGEVSEGV